MPDITCRIYIMWRGQALFPKFVHMISKWDCSMSSYRLFLWEYISWMNLPTFTYISVHSLTNLRLKPYRMISHFVFILELRSSTTTGSGIDRSTLSHARERTVSSPGQTNNTCWALSLCAVSHGLHALLSKLHCMPRGWSPCNTFIRLRSKKRTKLRIISLCEGNLLVTSEFLAQRSSNAENVSIWWRHHECQSICHLSVPLSVYW